MLPEWIEVRCYSGHTYAQEPRSFVWRGREYVVESIERAWREPAGPRWRVRSAAGTVTLGYDEAEDAWWLEIASPSFHSGSGLRLRASAHPLAMTQKLRFWAGFCLTR